jgi:tetratricopeptide (TPR) repeat protein
LGRTALAKQEYQRAVQHLEDVLERDPQAVGAHYPLALAYAGLGDARKADVHLKQRREHDILPADPLMVELDELLQSAQTHETLGIRALDAQDWNAAAAQFRRGLALEPDHAALRHRLGTALYMKGEHAAARAEFEHAIRVSPEFARAHYSLGVLAAAEGQHADAIRYFSTALQHQADYAEAHLRLAASLRALGRPGESLAHYQKVLAYPHERVYILALARLLAAAPDAQVRDGRRALTLVQDLLRAHQPTPDVGETMAMALAELGRYPEAIGIQRDLIAGGQKAGADAVVRRLTDNLRLYERGEPCRTPWRDDELL